jgi:hypothetical protein
VTIDPATAGFTADELVAGLADAGIESRPLWKPMHLQPVFKDAETLGGEVSAALFARGVTLPSNPNQLGFHDRLAEAIAAVLP